MMRYALLALLSTGPSYGYELKQALDARFGAVWPQINIGQIYTTLQRLERDGLVESLEVVVEERNKRGYRITADGSEALTGWMADQSGGTPRLRDEFFTKLMLAEATGAGDRFSSSSSSGSGICNRYGTSTTWPPQTGTIPRPGCSSRAHRSTCRPTSAGWTFAKNNSIRERTR